MPNKNTPKRLFDKTEWDKPENVPNTPWLGTPFTCPDPLGALANWFKNSKPEIESAETLEAAAKGIMSGGAK